MVSRGKMLVWLALLVVLNCVIYLDEFQESAFSHELQPSSSNEGEALRLNADSSFKNSDAPFPPHDFSQQERSVAARAKEYQMETLFAASVGTSTAEQEGNLAIEQSKRAARVPTWLMYTAASPYTYKAAHSFCKGNGGALCAKHDICPDGQLSKLIRGNHNGQTTASKDKWTPYSDSDNGWVQTGGKHHPQCTDHARIGSAAWGISGTNAFGTTMCCVLPGLQKAFPVVPVSTSLVAHGLGAADKDQLMAMNSHKKGDCRKFENVDLPFDAEEWGSNIRPAKGASIYGTGWAQRRLREHQFPPNCDGQKFVEHGMFRSGMGANMHISAAVLAHALNWERIYVWPEDDTENPWTEGANKSSGAECPSGANVRTYECYLKPISWCKSDGLGPKFVGMAKARGKKTLRGTEVIPEIFKPLLQCSGYPKDYWRKWWRAQAAAFILRPNPAMQRALQEFRKTTLVNNVWRGTIGTHVRHGDKYYEATEYPFEDYLRVFNWIAGKSDEVTKRCGGAAKLLAPFSAQLQDLRSSSASLYIGTDDPQVIQEAMAPSLDWKVAFMNVSRVQKRMPLMTLRKRLGPKQTVLESLLNMQLLMESDAFVCTWTSNWCRLVDEMRMTVALKANHISLEIKKHCPSFNWVHGGGKPTADYR